MVGRVGNDLFGRQMVETLSSHGVRCDCLQPDTEADSGVALVLVDQQAENVIVVNAGANMRISPADVDAAADLIRAADVLLVQSRDPAGSRRARAGCRARGPHPMYTQPRSSPTAARPHPAQGGPADAQSE